MKIKDIAIVPEFVQEWERLPNRLKKRLDRKLLNMMDSGTIINSFQAHRVKQMEEPMWIGYLSMGKGGWRILFDFDVNGNLRLLHVLTHNEMDRLLDRLVKYA